MGFAIHTRYKLRIATTSSTYAVLLALISGMIGSIGGAPVSGVWSLSSPSDRDLAKFFAGLASKLVSLYWD